MKFLTLALLAHPILSTPLPRRDTASAIYTLRLSSPSTPLDNLYLTTTPNSTSLTTSPLPITPLLVHPIFNPTTGLSELHTSASSTLAVVGANGLLDFSSLADPAAVAVPDGTTVDWTRFELVEEDSSREEGTVKYAGGVEGGRWVAFPTGEAWSVKWKGAEAWTTENYMPVQVVYELVKEE
ncbi:hypothetical protein C8A05DRAFT_30368 [Staphylotrichum tortipilum]|uniref:Uncharacterized protein n=1 Tax=Staphylotrichum tortipilum TaxID=2831512 RepID=A0AAN6RXI7_9PEZI|nr:hypothetical protein C8A05DRAFT_30368 [Staphylotrichum longicolle]